MIRTRRPLRLGDCTFEPPNHWSAEVVATGPVEDGFRPNFAAACEPSLPNEDAEDFAARALPRLQEALSEYELVDEGPAQFGEVKGWLREHTFTHDGRRFGQLQLYVVSYDVARIFTFTHLADHLEHRRGAAETFFATIRIFPPAPERLKVGLRG